MNQLLPVRLADASPECPGLTQAAEGLPRRAFTVAEVEAMVEAGIIRPKERFEMIGGELVPMPAKGARHEWVKHELARHLYRTLPDELAVMIDTTLRLDLWSYIEPDFVVVPRASLPGPIGPSDVRLAIEVADTSLVYDTGRKIAIYAAHGIPEVWVINAKTLVTSVFRGLGIQPYAGRSQIAADEELSALMAPAKVSLAELGLTPASDDEDEGDAR